MSIKYINNDIGKMNAKQGEVGTSAVIKTIMEVMRK